MTDTPARLTFAERQKQAILAEAQERQAEFNRVADIVLPKRHDPYHRRSERVTDVINLDGDYVVKVVDGDKEKWTFVVGGKRSSWVHHTQEAAILHLIAARYDDNPNSNCSAAFYAGRVLGIPFSDD